MLKYAGDLLEIIVGMLEESTPAHKREIVVRTLGQVVASTGLVIEPYSKFPNLLKLLLDLLVTDPEQSVRKEVSISVITGVSNLQRCDRSILKVYGTAKFEHSLQRMRSFPDGLWVISCCYKVFHTVNSLLGVLLYCQQFVKGFTVLLTLIEEFYSPSEIG